MDAPSRSSRTRRALLRVLSLTVGIAWGLGTGCGGREAPSGKGALATVTAAQLEPLFRELLHRADPQGAVLVVFWSEAEPVPKSFAELAGRWRKYGLATLAIEVEGKGGKPPSPLRGVRYRGSIEDLERIIGFSAGVPGVILLSGQGRDLWRRSDFDDVDGLESIIQVHLGEPSVAQGEEGCVCEAAVPARIHEAPWPPSPRARAAGARHSGRRSS